MDGNTKVGDLISVDGHGKGVVTGFGGCIDNGILRSYVVVKISPYLSCLVRV